MRMRPFLTAMTILTIAPMPPDAVYPEPEPEPEPERNSKVAAAVAKRARKRARRLATGQ